MRNREDNTWKWRGDSDLEPPHHVNLIRPHDVEIVIDGRHFVKCGEGLYGHKRCAKCDFAGSLCGIVGELEVLCGDGFMKEVHANEISARKSPNGRRWSRRNHGSDMCRETGLYRHSTVTHGEMKVTKSTTQKENDNKIHEKE